MENPAEPRPFSVSPEAAEEYESSLERLLSEMDREMEAEPEIDRLVGGQLAMMRQNHRHHAVFMASVFRLNDSELLDQTVRWVYRAYLSHGFLPGYFPLELEKWKEVLGRLLSAQAAGEIHKVYDWMLERHEVYTRLAEQHREESPEGISTRWGTVRDSFLEGLLRGEIERCLAAARDSVKSREELEEFYDEVVWTAMKEIGNRWEKGTLTVAQEHLATAIVSRVLSVLFDRFWHPASKKAKAVIAASCNEFHELGARAVGDLLEIDGWEVHYLGSNLPVEALVETVQRVRPFLLGISVTIPFNLRKAEEAIRLIRSKEELSGMKILLGGGAFRESGDLWKRLGADACPMNAREALKTANDFLGQRP